MEIFEDFKFNKNFGQNFISDKNLLSAIVKDSGVSLNDSVLEIGTGAGTLTLAISEKAKKVVTYEIDKKLTEYLKEKFEAKNNIKSIIGDALKTDINNIEKDFEGDYYIIANLPYYITTPLIFKFLKETQKAKVITIMVQKEVAEKIVAKSNSKNYGIISVILQSLCEAKITRIVNKKMFTPKPKVDSAIIKLTRKKDVFYDDKFANFVSGIFAMKRKTLYNNLTKMAYEKDCILQTLKHFNLSETVRSETLDYDKIRQIYQYLNKTC